MTYEITHEQLKELVHYDPDTGVFTKKVRLGRKAPGSTLGSTDANGYVYLSVNYRTYAAHRLAWFYMTGQWPDHTVDHIDGDTSNNRFSNLRDIPRSENSRHRPNGGAQKAFGLPQGVYPSGNNRFKSSICVDRVVHRLGTFDTPEDAHAAYLEFRSKISVEKSH